MHNLPENRLGTDHLTSGGAMFFSSKNILILNVKEKNNLTGQERKKYSDLPFSQYNHAVFKKKMYCAMRQTLKKKF